MPIVNGSIGLWNMNGSQETLFVKAIARVFILALSSFTYAITLSNNSYQTSEAFNCIDIATLVVS
jgi:hypothetical protein